MTLRGHTTFLCSLEGGFLNLDVMMIQGLVVDGCQPLVMDDGPTLRHSAFLKYEEAGNGYRDCIGLACVSLSSILASSHHITFEHLIVQEVALQKFTVLLSAVSGPINIISLELLFVFSSILLQCLLSKLVSSKHYVDELLQRAIFF